MTPSNANIEPIERSIPPVMITTPIATLNMPNNPIDLVRFERLACQEKPDWQTSRPILSGTLPQSVTEKEPQENGHHSKFFLLIHVRISLVVV